MSAEFGRILFALGIGLVTGICIGMYIEHYFGDGPEGGAE